MSTERLLDVLALLALLPPAATFYFFVFWRWFETWRRHRVLTYGMMFGTFAVLGAAVFVGRDLLLEERVDLPPVVQWIGWAVMVEGGATALRAARRPDRLRPVPRARAGALPVPQTLLMARAVARQDAAVYACSMPVERTETSKRSIVKAVTYRGVILCLDFLAIYLFTGKIDVALGFMVVSNVYTTVGYFVHERVWARVRWGVVPARAA